MMSVEQVKAVGVIPRGCLSLTAARVIPRECLPIEYVKDRPVETANNTCYMSIRRQGSSQEDVSKKEKLQEHSMRMFVTQNGKGHSMRKYAKTKNVQDRLMETSGTT